MKKIDIFTDGACKGNPGPGGYGIVMKFEGNVKELKGYDSKTTNNQMELLAAIVALESLKESCDVALTSDSKYLSDGVTKWLKNWKRNGWKTSAKKDVKNKELWKRVDTQAIRHKISWYWVKGHAGHAENERCDTLANLAITLKSS